MTESLVTSSLDEKSLNTHLENIEIKGYTIVENVIPKSECILISSKLDKLNQEQIKEYGEERLKVLKEWGTIRALIEKDDYFVKTILNQTIFKIISKIIGDTAILHLHNGIVTESSIKHWGNKFHRDFDKPFYSDKPLSINAFWAIDDFNEKSGGTWVVPFSHKVKDWPSDEYMNKNATQTIASAGSVLIFDSRLIHRGGDNTSGNYRRAINHQYTKPFIKQQIDFPGIMQNRFDLESKISQVLGFWSIPPKTVEQFRSDPDKRTYRSGQG
jgi:ectoine hydroxylase-related dioxygenase (phytanoyl-CoA dioxygenase family)